jgi:hypothetical protein
VIRRGLELRYPSRANGVAPPVVDPDEHIEKTISLSFDLPLLGAVDAATILDRARLPTALSPKQLSGLVQVLGTNPRRLKRFGTSISVWLDIARQINDQRSALVFAPLAPGNLDLFLKLAAIGYVNSGVIDQMIRDPALARRLQEAGNAAINEQSPQAAKIRIDEMLKNELPVIRSASMDPALWRALTLLEPDLAQDSRLPAALRWFRTLATQ